MTYPVDPGRESVAPPLSSSPHRIPRARPGWAPRWAVVVAWTALALLCAPAVLSAGFVLDDLATTGEKFDGMGVALGSMGLGATALVAVPLAWFVLRGGKVVFGVGAALSAAVVAFVLLLGFGDLLTGLALWLLVAVGVLAAVFAWYLLGRRDRSDASRAEARR